MDNKTRTEEEEEGTDAKIDSRYMQLFALSAGFFSSSSPLSVHINNFVFLQRTERAFTCCCC